MYIFNFHQNYTREYVPDLIPCMVDTASLKGELLFCAKLLRSVRMFESSVSLQIAECSARENGLLYCHVMLYCHTMQAAVPEDCMCSLLAFTVTHLPLCMP